MVKCVEEDSDGNIHMKATFVTTIYGGETRVRVRVRSALTTFVTTIFGGETVLTSMRTNLTRIPKTEQ